LRAWDRFHIAEMKMMINQPNMLPEM